MFHRTASRLALGLFAAASAIALYSAPAARAEDINVGNYESGTNGFPWAVAMEEGFFKKYGLNITGIRNASGGQAIRQVIAGDLLFGDQHGIVAIPPEIAAEVPAVATRQLERERAVADLCRSSEFTLDKLRSLVRQLG